MKHLRNTHASSVGWFNRFAKSTARLAGRPMSFIAAVGIIVIWAVSGPMFGFSDTWQLVINTGTTIITFLMVFLIQNTQNRDAEAIHIKLDELIQVNHAAHNALLDLENVDDEELEAIRETYRKVAQRAHPLTRHTRREKKKRKQPEKEN